MAKKLQKSSFLRGCVIFGLVNFLCVIFEYQRSQKDHPRENPRSLWSPKLELWPKNCKKSQFFRGCVIFGLVKFLWDDIETSGKSQGSSTQKPQVSIKSETGVIAKKLQKITISERLRDVWFGNFLWDDIGISGKSQGSSTRKCQVSIKFQTGVMAKKLQKITIFER